MESLKEIIDGLLLICLSVTITWRFIFRLMYDKKIRNLFMILNIGLFILYMSYIVYGRINWSQYGAALVWEFYGVIIPLFHTFLVLLVALLIKKYGKTRGE